MPPVGQGLGQENNTFGRNEMGVSKYLVRSYAQ
jgi:hypothetical protein